MKNALLVTLFLSFILSSSAHAELIHLRNGKVVRGNIVKVTPVFIRLATRDKYGRKEYLIDEINGIEEDKTQQNQLSQTAIENIQLRKKNKTNKELRKAAIDKATELVADAMQEINVKNFEQTPDNVRSAALEVANQLILEAMNKIDNTKISKKDSAKTAESDEKLIQSVIEDVAEGMKVVTEDTTPEAEIQPEKIQEASVKDEGKKYKKRLIYTGTNQTVYQLIPIDSEEE